MAPTPPMGTTPPTVPPPAAGDRKRQPDIRKLARRQRWIIWLVLISILSQFAPLLPWGQFGPIAAIIAIVCQLTIHVLLVVGVVLLLTADGTHPLLIVPPAILMVAPCINLVVLVAVNVLVTHRLRRAGLRVGLLGVNPDEVERVVNPELCSACGYNLTGNVSGVCPECGRATGP